MEDAEKVIWVGGEEVPLGLQKAFLVLTSGVLNPENSPTAPK